jgi:hypothetical protein
MLRKEKHCDLCRSASSITVAGASRLRWTGYVTMIEDVKN